MGIAPFNINMKKNPKDENRYWVEMEVPVLKKFWTHTHTKMRSQLIRPAYWEHIFFIVFFLFSFVLFCFVVLSRTNWTQHTYINSATHLCVSKLTIIGSDNGLSPSRWQDIIQTSAGILLIGPLGTNFSEISIEIITFSFRKMRLKRRLWNSGHFVVVSMCWWGRYPWWPMAMPWQGAGVYYHGHKARWCVAEVQSVPPSGNRAEILPRWASQYHIDALLAPRVAMSPATMLLTTSLKGVLVLQEEWLQSPESFQFWEIIVNVNLCLCFLK